MKLTWILVADSSRARIFKSEKNSSIQEIEDLTHPEGRLHDQDLTSDFPGRDADRSGAGKHEFQDQVEPKEQEAIDFAKRIARHLEESYNTNKFEQLMIISAPSFLGKLRQQLSNEISQQICFELDKNITMHEVDDIRKHLPEHFPNL